ncbi:potassium voltage-gated channel subfamily E member 4 [Oryzias melastigma]|nr:potassium voltage-gated channel subfamily E member 4 [Oryzias melastigma]
MENLENSTPSLKRVTPQTQSTAGSQAANADGNAYLYILIVMSFYAVFLCGIMLGYFRSKRREKRRVNIFTRLVHEEQQREWGTLPKKHSLTFAATAAGLSLPFCGNHGNHFGLRRHEGSSASALACALCAEQSSISSLCSSAETRIAIEEESDGEHPKGGSEHSDSG